MVNVTRLKKTKYVRGSGNVFADLGVAGADELYARAQIGFGIYRILKCKNLNRRAIANILAISEAEVSHLMNGHFSRFTTDKLIDFLKRLDWKVTIEVSARKPGEPYQIIEFCS
jgi:predicted XRE-type DNA-binding protein